MIRPRAPRPRVFLYGFSSFGVIRENPSELALRRLRKRLAARLRLRTAVFRVSYRDVRRRLPQILKTSSYDLVLGIGVSAGAQRLRLETCARNRADPHIADADGRKHRTGIISRKSPRLLRSNVPVKRLALLMKKQGMPVEVSDDAGGYLCNYAYYLAAASCRKSSPGTVFGFLHVPLHAGYIRRAALRCSGLPLGKILKAAESWVSLASGLQSGGR